MRISSKLLSLPASLLLLLLSSPVPLYAGNEGQSPAQWKYDNPTNSKYSSGDSHHRKREFEVVQSHIRAGHAPVVVKKMTEDESEMFFPEYWGFREQIDQSEISDSGPFDAGSGWSSRKQFKEEEEEARTLMNSSTVFPMRPPYLVRATQETTLSGRDLRILVSRHIKSDKNAAAAALALLQKRQLACPAGMSACSNMPSICCNIGDNCVSIPDNGIGSIGCCPFGLTCSGPIECIAGNVPCNSTIGGGCCGPGDMCATIGCVPDFIATTSSTVVATSTQAPIPSTNLIVVTTVVTPSLSASASTSTVTLTASPSRQPTTTSTVSTSIIASPSTTETGTTSPSAPARATTTATTPPSIGSSTQPTTTATDSSCPTGFYVCSAYYPGGCCRMGRDCSEVNCPSTAYTTLISSGETIVVPLTGAATSVATGTCATGWYSCAATDGGSCCPSGWSCGQESCTSTGATATQTEAKEGVLLNGSAGLVAMTSQLLVVFCLMLFLFLIA